jgi:hypothetical protein
MFFIHQGANVGRTNPGKRAKLVLLGRVLRGAALLLLLLLPLPNRARPGLVRVPFRTVQSMILVDGKVNDNRVTFLLDTGANNSIISLKAYGSNQFQLCALHDNDSGPGMIGSALRLHADLAFANRIWISQPVSVMNMDSLTQRFKTPIDGLLGQDLLREFRSIRIDYRSHVLELEQ